ncbi:hypothetical protein FH972_025978 [Carpinus fangiana]|uniref:Uncharacterized protein n=1 Tax=Carpinus fangiana TaxID=176857 RepID=A0A5N6L352_9ROSI|nr:hypothetical protein FH972_025978 [Carpinus fangiana]
MVEAEDPQPSQRQDIDSPGLSREARRGGGGTGWRRRADGQRWVARAVEQGGLRRSEGCSAEGGESMQKCE